MRALSMRVETGRTECDEDTFNPEAWYVALYEEEEDSEYLGEEVVEFAGIGNKVLKYEISPSVRFSDEEQKEFCGRVVDVLRAMLGSDFEPKFPHQLLN